MASRQYWLVKSEPGVYSIDDLARDKRTSWEGVRNYQARNYLKAQHKGDRVLFYHSNCDEPGVVGVAEVAAEAYADGNAFDPDSKYFDPKSNPADPTWFMTDLKFVAKFPRTVSLRELQNYPQLEGMVVTRKGNRLSVTPVDEEHFNFIVQQAKRMPK
jgi:predicted RNA-binding protein with PUA-like domain